MNASEIEKLRRHRQRVRRHEPVLKSTFVYEFEQFNTEEINIIYAYSGPLRFRNENKFFPNG